MTVGRLLAEISSAELTEWIAYEQISGPLGQARTDIHTAMIGSWIVNSQRGKRGPLPLRKFLPGWVPRPQQSPEEIYSRIRQINAALGGTEAEPRE
ncbi:hypothetical protein ACFYUV_38095 [Nonomuraea sp. NPDC003560]|uniref:phage tail assembly protein T n=1 Tax=Nonomuraea sp. NPDC003560 TaxID=3364341 RepID=UPI0036C87529